MSATLAADAVLVLHGLFIVFAVFGAALLWRWPRIVWLHLPAVLWGAYVEFSGSLCPLTPLENHLRRAAGGEGYSGGFVEHYLMPLIYPAGLTGDVQTLLGVGVVLINVLLYSAWLTKATKGGRAGKHPGSPNVSTMRTSRPLTWTRIHDEDDVYSRTVGPAAQRPVHRRRSGLERGRRQPGAGPAFCCRPRPPAVDHAARRAEGGAAQQRERAPQCRRQQRRSFTQPGRFSATATIGADGLVSQVDSTFPDPVLGDTKAVTTYSEYRDAAGIKFPQRVRQSVGGSPTLDLSIKEVQANPALALAVIDAVKALAPGKPIRFAVNSHQHFDHSGGVRAAVAEGATIVTQAANVPYFERVLAQPNSVQPDRLARAAKPVRLQAVAEKATLADATRTIELHRIAGSQHTDSFLMVYLPKEKLLIEADAFTPGPPNAPPPAVANANNLNLIDNIERLKLSIDRILPLHGRVVPVAELYAAVGKTPSR